MVYLFLNADEYLADRRLSELKHSLGDAEMAGLNTSELGAGGLRALDLLAQASMMPFLTERRLVIVRGFLDALDKRMAQSKSADSAAHQEAAQLLVGLAQAPESCDLVFVDEGVDKRRGLWKGFTIPKGEDKPERKIAGLEALIAQKQVRSEGVAAPDAKALPGWLQAHCKARKIAIDGRAIQILAEYVGPNLRQLDNELEKLVTYAAGRSVTGEDVKLLVSDASEALIWALTDALSQRDGRGAMRTLWELRSGDAHPIYLLTMIARQYRLLIKVKEAMRSSNSEDEIARRIKESSYPVKKAMTQVGKYSFAELEQILERLLEADYAMKTGADANTEIDLLIAELTQKR